MSSNIFENLEEDQRNELIQSAKELLGRLIQEDQYIGELYSIGYEHALVQIHDRHRMDVGGIPSLSFLVATRIKQDKDIDYTKEDSSVILLRVIDSAPLPNATEMERIRVETAQRASGEDKHWDEPGLMDSYTANYLSFAGVKCRVIGTFYLDDSQGTIDLRFGSDISNYYPNRGLKVYKPNGGALTRIVNYRDKIRIQDHPLAKFKVDIGEIRYASTNRPFQGVSDVRVHIAPADLLNQKTALFGMTRTGKSNSTKIIAKSVFELRFKNSEIGRIGQLIFDYNGEYANENIQDANSQSKNPSALKNVWRCNPKGEEADVVTYGTTAHISDPKRKLMKLNFFLDDNLQIGKEIINQALLEHKGSKYIENFLDVSFKPPETGDVSATVRYKRAVLSYRALLVKAGFATPKHMGTPNLKGLFNPDLLKIMRKCEVDNDGRYEAAAKQFNSENPKWTNIADAFEALREFIDHGDDTGYNDFNRKYIQKSSTGSSWHDQTLLKILEMYRYQNGARLIGRVEPQHSPDLKEDYTDAICADLAAGRLVIVDQSAGDPLMNKSAAERVMWKIFKNNQEKFSNAQIPTSILIYIEEAHNLLPSGSDMDLSDVWVRTAKEGAKLHIGLVYSTQEVSSIQKNILKNTANWFIGHLNNTDETKELCKYYDFADFEPSIRKAQDRGFIRVKTLSNLFVIPVQIDKFEV